MMRVVEQRVNLDELAVNLGVDLAIAAGRRSGTLRDLDGWVTTDLDRDADTPFWVTTADCAAVLRQPAACTWAEMLAAAARALGAPIPDVVRLALGD